MNILDSKEIIINEIHKIIDSYKNNELENSSSIKFFSDEITRLNTFNKKLLNEINEKDKLIIQNEKTIYDYEQMIHKMETKTEIELESKEKFDMIRSQDKEIHQKNMKIKELLNENEKLKNDIQSFEENMT